MDVTTHPQRLVVCTACRRKGRACRPGLELIAALRKAFVAAGGAVASDFEVSGVASMTGCDQDCTVAYYATARTICFFGDIEPGTDMHDLLSFARQYRDIENGWPGSTTQPGKLRQPSVARVPGALIVAEAGPLQ